MPRDRAAIARQYVGDACGEPFVTIEAALEFDQERYPPGDQIAQFAERHHVLATAAERHALEHGSAETVQRAFAFGEAAERIVMVHHGFAVGTDLHIGLDGIAGFDRGPELRRPCFRSRRLRHHAGRDGRQGGR